MNYKKAFKIWNFIKRVVIGIFVTVLAIVFLTD